MNADQAESVVPPGQGVRRRVLVWDAPTRLFHWLVVALVAAAYATLKLRWIDWHIRAGEALLALLVFRLLWGHRGLRCGICRTSLAGLATIAASRISRSATMRPAGIWFCCCSPCCCWRR
jgi:cytochrome b